MMIKGVLFDMDGVLVDSEEYICKAAIKMFEEKGLTVKPEDFTPFVGTGEARYLGGVAEKYNFQVNLDEIKERTYEIYGEMVKGKLKPLPGVHQFIEKCKSKNLKLAVATSADKVKMDINLNESGLDHKTFDVLVNGKDVDNKKPHPEIYQKAAHMLQLEPQDCLVVEDAINGIEAAKAAGARCLALTTSFQPDELIKADWISNTLLDASDEVINW